MIIGIGNGRSGTTTLVSVLNTAENAQFYHERDVYPWLRLEKIGYSTDKPLAEIGGTFPPQWPEKCKIVGDINGYLSPFILRFYQADNTTKAIYLLRHPSDIITSYMNAGAPMSDDWSNPDVALWESNRWRPFDDKIITDRFTRICLYWKYTNERICDMLSKMPSKQVIEIKIEELSDNIHKLWEWCGLRGNENIAIEVSRKKSNTREPTIIPPFPYYIDWDGIHKQIFADIVESSMAFKYKS